MPFSRSPRRHCTSLPATIFAGLFHRPAATLFLLDAARGQNRMSDVALFGSSGSPFCPSFPFTLLFGVLGPSPLNAVDFNSRMNALIENLVKLQAIELNRARLNQEMRALPAEIAQARLRWQRPSANLPISPPRWAVKTRCAPAWIAKSATIAKKRPASAFNSTPSPPPSRPLP